MKFIVVFKTPDTLSNTIGIVLEQVGDVVSDDQKHELIQQITQLAEDYIYAGESVTLEFDTDNASVRVRQARKAARQSDQAVQAWVKDNPGWHYALTSLAKVFVFSDFNSSMAFANRIAMWAERHDHHPQLRISWNKVEVVWYTQDINGITVHDFAGAAATDSYYRRQL